LLSKGDKCLEPLAERWQLTIRIPKEKLNDRDESNKPLLTDPYGVG